MNCTLIMMDCQPSIGPIIFGGWWSLHQLDDNDQVNRKINTSSVASAHNGVSGAWRHQFFRSWDRTFPSFSTCWMKMVFCLFKKKTNKGRRGVFFCANFNETFMSAFVWLRLTSRYYLFPSSSFCGGKWVECIKSKWARTGGLRYEVQKQQVAFRRAVTLKKFGEETRNEDDAAIHPIIHPAELRCVMVYKCVWMRSSSSTLHIVSRFSISSRRAQSQQKRHYFMVLFVAGGWLPAAGWCSLKWWLHLRAKRSFRFLRAFVVFSWREDMLLIGISLPRVRMWMQCEESGRQPLWNVECRRTNKALRVGCALRGGGAHILNVERTCFSMVLSLLLLLIAVIELSLAVPSFSSCPSFAPGDIFSCHSIVCSIHTFVSRMDLRWNKSSAIWNPRTMCSS